MPCGPVNSADWLRLELEMKFVRCRTKMGSRKIRAVSLGWQENRKKRTTIINSMRRQTTEKSRSKCIKVSSRLKTSSHLKGMKKNERKKNVKLTRGTNSSFFQAEALQKIMFYSTFFCFFFYGHLLIDIQNSIHNKLINAK